MTDAELTRAVVAVYRNACAEIDRLVKGCGVPVYRGKYGLRRLLKHSDGSCKVEDGREIMGAVMRGSVGIGLRDGILVQATPDAVRRMQAKIDRDVARDCAQDIARASAQIVKCEEKLRSLAKTGSLSESQIRKIVSEVRK